MFTPVLAFLERFGTVMGRIVMSVIYVVAVAPVAIFYRLFTDKLRVKAQPDGTFSTWNAVNETLDDARRQD